MKLVYDTIVACRNESSTKLKLAILMAQKGNADLASYLKMAYEPKINYYVRKVQPELAAFIWGTSEVFDADQIADIFDRVACRDITGMASRTYLANLHRAFANDWERELLELMIQRDVKAGFSRGSINKVWPGLITDIPYMRCSLPKDLPKGKTLADWPWSRGILSEIKADGMFANINHTMNGAVTIESRNGSPFPLEYFKDLVAEVQLYIPTGMQTHGELLIKRNGKILPREDGNGIFNSILQGGEFEPGDTAIYHVWDLIPVAEAKPKNKYKIPYSERFQRLEDLFEGVADSLISVIEYEIVYSLKEAYEHCRRAMMLGLEGTVIKHPDMIWEDTTSLGQVKLKLEFVVELKVVGMNAADSKSKNKDTFGSLQCESSDGKLKVGVTGLKDDKRQEIFDNWATYQFSIIAVRANGIMAPDAERGGFFSLFLPRFVEDRLDKIGADSLVRIQAIQQAAIECKDMIDSL